MTEHNAQNERIKHKYFAYLKEAKRQSEETVDAAASALNRFEVYTKHRDFRLFHIDQATAFKTSGDTQNRPLKVTSKPAIKRR